METRAIDGEDVVTLFVFRGARYTIVDNSGREWTTGEARDAYLSERAIGGNTVFHRLIHLDFDMDALRQHYRRSDEVLGRAALETSTQEE
jgi:hypothetical protein